MLLDAVAAGRVDGVRIAHRLGAVSPAATAMVLSKIADSVATLVGLTVSPRIVETNPYLRYTMAHLGTTLGVLAATFLLLFLVIAVTEVAVGVGHRLDPDAKWVAGVIRFVGYVPLTMVFVAVTLHNVTVIIQAITV